MLFSRFRFGVAVTSVPLCGSSLEGLQFNNTRTTLVVPPKGGNGLSCGKSVLFVAMAKGSKRVKATRLVRDQELRSLFLGGRPRLDPPGGCQLSPIQRNGVGLIRALSGGSWLSRTGSSRFVVGLS